MSGPRDLAGLVASRICHDLISPVGALGNGMELIDASGGDIGEELELIRSCSDAARFALTYMRIAFGAAGPEDTVDPAETMAAARPYLAAKRLTLSGTEGETEGGGDRSRLRAKARLLTLLAAVDAAPRGATAIPLDADALIWAVTGASLNSDTPIERLAAPESCGAREAHYPVLHDVARNLGRTPFAEARGPERFEIGLR
ncbi:MAG: hypothetical protein AAFN79_01170 [Pseudomonadota bacterium]